MPLRRRRDTAARRGPATLFRNTLASSAAKIAGYLFSFISAPIILSGLGLREFGIWALTGGLVQYGAVLDLGVGVSLGRFVAANADDRRTCGEYVAVAWLLAPALSGVLAVAAVLGAGPLAGSVGVIGTGEMRVVLLCSVALLGLSLFGNAVSTYAVGRRRMVVPNVANVVAAVVNFVASVGSIALGAHLEGYALANVGAGVVGLILEMALVFGLEGVPPFSRPRFVRVRELVGYSIRYQAVSVSSLVNYQTDKIVIALSVGAGAAGAYELANRAAVAVREIGIWATSATPVQLTAEFAETGMRGLRLRYGRLTAVTAAIGIPPILLAVATGPLLLAAWLGTVPRYSEMVLVVLSAAYLPAATTGVGFAVAMAAGRPGLPARPAILSAAANIVLTVGLAPLFGIWGILAGTAVALIGGQVWQIVAVHRAFGLPAAAYLDAVRPPVWACGLLAVPLAIACYGVAPDGRGAEIALVTVAGTAYLLACGAWAARSGRLPTAVLERMPRRLRGDEAPLRQA